MPFVSYRWCCVCTVIGVSLVAGSSASHDISFRNEIAPVLLANCYGCHNAKSGEGSYRMDSFESLLKPGDSSEIPIVGGQGDKSELLRRLVTEDADERMPLEGDPLPMPTIDLVRKWIVQGAKYDAEDRTAPLASILPITKHPEPPQAYRFPLAITSVAFVGEDLWVGGYHEIICWNWQSKKIASRITQVGQRIYSMEFDERSGRVYVGSGTPGALGEVRIIDAKSHELIGVPLITDKVVLDVALNPSGKLLAAAGADSKIHLIDLREGRVVRSIDSHSDWVQAVVWSQDGATLASASRDKTAKIFDVASGKPTTNYAAHGAAVTDVNFVFGRSDQIVSCDAKGGLHFWQAGDGKKSKDWTGEGDRAFRVLSAREGVWLASSADSIAQIAWAGEEQIRRLAGHREWVLSMATDGDARWLATGDLAGRVRVWELSTNTLFAEFTAFPMQQPLGDQN